MNTPNPMLFDENPLNLECDDLLQADRPSTCQERSEIEEGPLSEVRPLPCCSSDRELDQVDFQTWVV
ncbi:hypothetical protein SH661x_004536 [Planctomicrobium sp. SH661]|uniref:hypothetical protein n=1 Tax=Planctomicrobium sp. SH661 TaxID=3448124 RepID=UPI003F5B951D